VPLDRALPGRGRRRTRSPRTGSYVITARGAQSLDTLDAAQDLEVEPPAASAVSPADPLDEAGRRASIAQDPLMVGAPGSIPRTMSEPGKPTTVRM
jgi:hypothetical protein